MGNAARKARKRMRRTAASYGEIANPSEFQFRHPVKVPTPYEERSEVVGLVPGPGGTNREGRLQPRSEKRLRRMFAARGLNYDARGDR